MVNKIYIGNISPKTTDKDLLDLFSKAGEVVSVKIVQGMNLIDNARHGYVVMKNTEEMRKAISKYNNCDLKGNKIRVVIAHSIDQNENFFANQNRYRNNRRF